MIVKRLTMAAILFALGPALGSCAGGASENAFSAAVADHWPHWAGGMPDDVPPRPGAPGYNEFIAHGQTGQDATNATAATGSGANMPSGDAPKVNFQQRPAPSARQTAPAVAQAPSGPAASAAPAEPADDRPSQDPSVVKGGLY